MALTTQYWSFKTRQCLSKPVGMIVQDALMEARACRTLMKVGALTPSRVMGRERLETQRHANIARATGRNHPPCMSNHRETRDTYPCSSCLAFDTGGGSWTVVDNI